MKKISVAPASPKTLVVFQEEYEDKVLPAISDMLSSPAKKLGDKIYAVIAAPKGKVSFKNMELCDIKGA